MINSVVKLNKKMTDTKHKMQEKKLNQSFNKSENVELTQQKNANFCNQGEQKRCSLNYHFLHSFDHFLQIQFDKMNKFK